MDILDIPLARYQQRHHIDPHLLEQHQQSGDKKFERMSAIRVNMDNELLNDGFIKQLPQIMGKGRRT